MALPPHLADLESRLLGRFDEALQTYRRALDERLRTALEAVAKSADDVTPPALSSLLGDVSADAVEEAPRREGARTALEALLDTARSTTRSAHQTDALEALLSGCRPWCDRAALILTRDDGVELWGSEGFAEAPPARRTLPWSDSLRAGLLHSGCRRLTDAEAESLASALGLAFEGERILVPMVLQDRLAAVLCASRADGAVEPAALQLLVLLTAQRLELQALSNGAAALTLYDEAESGLSLPPLWSAPAHVEQTAPPAEPELEPEELWEPAGEALIEQPVPFEEPAAFEAPVEIETAPDVEAMPAATHEIVAPEDPAAPEVEEALEAAPSFELEDEPTVLSTSPMPDVDDLGTVRMPLVQLEPPPAGEPTAPLRIDREAVETPPTATTHEIPVAEPEPPPAPPAAAPPRAHDPNEDATVLTMKRPEWATPPPPPPVVPPAPEGEEEVNDRTASRGGARTTEVAPPPDVEGPGLAFAGVRAPRSSEQPAHEEAKRLARLLISEIKLYNEEQVLEGRRNRDLYHRLREDIDRSRQIYEERVDAEVRRDSDYFQQELVRSLAGGDPRALGI